MDSTTTTPSSTATLICTRCNRQLVSQAHFDNHACTTFPCLHQLALMGLFSNRGNDDERPSADSQRTRCPNGCHFFAKDGQISQCEVDLSQILDEEADVAEAASRAQKVEDDGSEQGLMAQLATAAGMATGTKGVYTFLDTERFGLKDRHCDA
ncbi:hypothetical protein K402DRAFT_407169 [Aulographum hederae CBS 113979]|uniref:C2H2-type domain-containing protein n=1 Tax=Aulographum hederae CBS 113979 TaxID=1176131 RepID=A0A6G1GQ27_9PEZI|nr:hypothetical protein K402DRAFT_407169 [Aulographum hederae CBS 113979]